MVELIFYVSIFLICLSMASIPLFVIKPKGMWVILGWFFFACFINTFFIHGQNLIYPNYAYSQSKDKNSQKTAAVKLICTEEILCRLDKNYNYYEIDVITESELSAEAVSGILNRARWYKAGYEGVDKFYVSAIKINFWIAENRNGVLFKNRIYKKELI